MPTYQFENKETGEITEEIMRIAELDAYKEANPHLRQVLGTPGFISQHGSTIAKAGHEWQDHLKRIHKGAGRNSKINV